MISEYILILIIEIVIVLAFGFLNYAFIHVIKKCFQMEDYFEFTMFLIMYLLSLGMASVFIEGVFRGFIL